MPVDRLQHEAARRAADAVVEGIGALDPDGAHELGAPAVYPLAGKDERLLRLVERLGEVAGAQHDRALQAGQRLQSLDLVLAERLEVPERQQVTEAVVGRGDPLGVHPKRAHADAPGPARIEAGPLVGELVLVVAVIGIARAPRQPLGLGRAACHRVARHAQFEPLVILALAVRKRIDVRQHLGEIGRRERRVAVGRCGRRSPRDEFEQRGRRRGRLTDLLKRVLECVDALGLGMDRARATTCLPCVLNSTPLYCGSSLRTRTPVGFAA